MSRLKESGKEHREALIAKNTKINPNNPYNITHPSAVSDGDDFGKYPNGSQADIEARERLLVKNIYNKNSQYDLSNA